MNRKFYSSLLLLLLAFTIYYIDVPVAKFSASINGSPLHQLAAGITDLGSFTYISLINSLVIIFLLYGYKKIDKNLYTRRLKLMAYGIVTQSILALLVQVFKMFFGRMRPYYFLMQDTENSFTFFKLTNELKSFPSGHSSGIWSLIICLIFVFNIKNKWIKLILIGIATIIPITRIILNKHFVSDTIAGSVFGIYFTYTVMKALQGKIDRKIKID